MKTDGSVIAWGNSTQGGDVGTEASKLSSGVVDIVSTSRAFAALKSDGSVVAWGYGVFGGDASAEASALASGVVKIVGVYNLGFAALKEDGTVVTWGNLNGYISEIPDMEKGVKDIVASLNDLAVLKTDGSVLSYYLSNVTSDSINTFLSSGIKELVSNEIGFLASKDDGTFFLWSKNGLSAYRLNEEYYFSKPKVTLGNQSFIIQDENSSKAIYLEEG